MRRITFTIILIYSQIFIVHLFAQIPKFDWVSYSEGSGTAETVAIEIDSLGNIYAVGTFAGSRDFDPGSMSSTLSTPHPSLTTPDVFIQKLDKSGNLIWAKSIGSSSEDYARDISIDKWGNIYVLGFFFGEKIDLDPGADSSFTYGGRSSRNPFLVKLDSNGNFLWGNTPVQSNSFLGYYFENAVDDSANVYLIGSYRSRTDFDPDSTDFILSPRGNNEIFISKFNAEGRFQWVKTFQGDQFGNGRKVAVDPQGNLLLTGFFIGSIDFDPGPDSLILSSTSLANGERDGFILKLDPGGSLIWAYKMDKATIPIDIQSDSWGNILLSGSYFQSSDFDLGPGDSTLSNQGDYIDGFISKYTPQGEFLWARGFGKNPAGFFGDNSIDEVNAIRLDRLGNIYATGFFEWIIDLDPGPAELPAQAIKEEDVFIIKLNPVGDLIWAKVIGGLGSDYGRAIALDNEDQIVTGGRFRGEVDFDFGSGQFNVNPNGNFGSSHYIMKINEAWPLSINNGLNSRSIRLFPNPFREYLTLKDEFNQVERVKIFNLAGRELLNVSYTSPNIQVGNLEPGFYTVQVFTRNSHIFAYYMVKSK